MMIGIPGELVKYDKILMSEQVGSKAMGESTGLLNQANEPKAYDPLQPSAY